MVFRNPTERWDGRYKDKLSRCVYILLMYIKIIFNRDVGITWTRNTIKIKNETLITFTINIEFESFFSQPKIGRKLKHFHYLHH